MWSKRLIRYWTNGLPARTGEGKWSIVLLLCVFCLCGCSKDQDRMQADSPVSRGRESFGVQPDAVSKEKQTETTGDTSVAEEQSEEASDESEKGYALSVSDEEQQEAKTGCTRIMDLYAALYEAAEKGDAVNAVLAEDTLLAMQKEAAKTRDPVIVSVSYANMENYTAADRFLKDCEKGLEGALVLYEIHTDGSLGRSKFVYDGENMYLVAANAVWADSGEPVLSHISRTRMKKWTYTDRGWFGYELCVPEPPEVTEIVDGSCMIRVLPFKEELRQLSLLCVKNIGYLGNNLLSSDWDEEHMENLEYNGLYPWLYMQQYQERFPYDAFSQGVPEKAFEEVMTFWLPVTPDRLRQYASYDEQTRSYACEQLGWSFARIPGYLGASLPEVTAVRENEDGTVTLTVAAVCDMVIYSDTFLISELTVKFADDGSFQYLGNRILRDEMNTRTSVGE